MFDLIAMFESPYQLLIILVIVLVLFGGGRIKDVMGSLGSGMREFKKGLNEEPEKPAAKTEAENPVAKSEAEKPEKKDNTTEN